MTSAAVADDARRAELNIFPTFFLRLILSSLFSRLMTTTTMTHSRRTCVRAVRQCARRGTVTRCPRVRQVAVARRRQHSRQEDGASRASPPAACGEGRLRQGPERLLPDRTAATQPSGRRRQRRAPPTSRVARAPPAHRSTAPLHATGRAATRLRRASPCAPARSLPPPAPPVAQPTAPEPRYRYSRAAALCSERERWRRRPASRLACRRCAPRRAAQRTAAPAPRPQRSTHQAPGRAGSRARVARPRRAPGRSERAPPTSCWSWGPSSCRGRRRR